jgi:hypothetical protein
MLRYCTVCTYGAAITGKLFCSERQLINVAHILVHTCTHCTVPPIMITCCHVLNWMGLCHENYDGKNVYRSIDHSSRMLDVMQQPTGQTRRFLIKLVRRSNCISLCADPGPAHQYRVHAHAMYTHAMHSCTMRAHAKIPHHASLYHSVLCQVYISRTIANYCSTALWTEIGFPYTCGEV